jgi:hypothetical protein
VTNDNSIEFITAQRTREIRKALNLALDVITWREIMVTILDLTKERGTDLMEEALFEACLNMMNEFYGEGGQT